MSRRFDIGLALLLALLTAAALLWPPAARRENLDLSMQVRELPPSERETRFGDFQQVEVTVRWHWRQAPGRSLIGRPVDSVAVVFDQEQWARISEPSGWSPPEGEELLRQAGEPLTIHRFPATPGQNGEMRVVLAARGNARAYHAPALDLRAQYVHVVSGSLVPPGHSWVKATGGTYPLR